MGCQIHTAALPYPMDYGEAWYLTICSKKFERLWKSWINFLLQGRDFI